MAEFALILTVALAILSAGVPLAPIGQTALAVSRGAYYRARYASVQTTLAAGNIRRPVVNHFPPNLKSQYEIKDSIRNNRMISQAAYPLKPTGLGTSGWWGEVI